MEHEIFWNAVKNNDARFDGAFFYAVRSTGIYCRPSCSSKLPKRDNVAFFGRPEAAEENGFRACRRCRPRETTADPRVETIVRACERLKSDEPATLAELAADAGLSDAHFQKLFKELVGVSPKKFAENHRLTRFKSSVANGDDVTTALYDAGFGSSSRLYETASAKLGMTPKTYANKGRSMSINYTIVDCKLGRLLVARTEKGVCAVAFGDDDAALLRELEGEYSNAAIIASDANLSEFVAAVVANIDGRERKLDLPLDLRATAFQMQVWEELRKIPYGETVSYSDVATRIGKPNSVRAVATACASNRVALVIPCHRVVGKSGALSGYKWGIERKKELLDREGAGQPELAF